MSRSKVFQVSIPNNVAAMLEEMAEDLYMSKSQFLTRAIVDQYQKWLSNNKGAKPQ